MNHKILLLGAHGQLGESFLKLKLKDSFFVDLTAWNSKEGDFLNPELLLKKINELKPNVIINAAAYTKVDLAETEKEICEQINANTPALLADYCKKNNAVLMHFSTDYVYRGDVEHFREESEALDPQNEYGKSKARGDLAIIESGANALIFRTSWVYSATGKNFFLTMLRLSKTRNFLKDGPLSVVSDQVGAPTYSDDLAMYAVIALKKALERLTSGKSFPTGVYHLCNSGVTNWADFAREIIGDSSKVKSIESKDYPTSAKRPLNSRLSLTKIEKVFGIQPRSYREALKDCLGLIDITNVNNILK